ncbi:MAG TPA: trigger factor [Candidatus Latescibacteria bacterium]|nr:trigger factor [Candidatus Latescibacterota bacterium]|tara:strand:+ start:2475 stop:3782 length:1308 start_codon:yes stop_codon:yes gene_type:complete
MKVQVTESDTWRRTLEVEVPGEDVEKRFDTAYRSYSKTLNLPGFRKGKIPLNVVRKRFGKAIQGEVLQEVMQEFYREASRSEGLNPVSEATIEEVDYDEGTPLTFKASVDIKPELEVEGYKRIKVTRPVFKVEDTDVEGHLGYLQDQGATEKVVDRAAELGDVILADIQEIDESGVPIVGRKQEDRTFLIGGRNATNHDLDNQLVGISAEEERRVNLKHAEADDHDHDEGHHHDHPDGQEVRFQVKAKEVRERELPNLDDEFAKDLGDFESLDALKDKIREDFQARADETSRRRLEENILDVIIEGNEFELPESMVENFLNNLVENYKKEHEGHDHDIDEAAIREESRPGAIRNLKRYLLLESIAKKEEIKVEEEDINKHLDGLSQQYNLEGSQMRQMLSRSGQLERMESELLETKSLTFLIDEADVDEVEEKRE